MRRVVVMLVVLCSLFAACGQWAPRFGHLQRDQRTFHFEHGIQLFEAPNGLRIALLPDPRTNLVTVDVRYTVGGAEEPAGRAGLAHLAEHVSFLGRADASGPTLSDRLADEALAFNAWTTADETHYTEIGFAEHLDDLLAIEAARMTAPCAQLDDTLFRRERDVVLEEEAQRRGALDDVAVAIAGEVWGPDHPYTRALGPEQLADATRDDACEFLSEHYGPDDAILVVTGAFDLDAATAAIGRAFGGVQARGVAPRVEIEQAALDGATTEHEAGVDHPTAVVYFSAPPWGGADRVRFAMAELQLRAALARAADDARWIDGTSVDVAGDQRERALVVTVTVDDEARLHDAVDVVYRAADAVAAIDRRDADVPVDWSVAVRQLSDRLLESYDAFAGRGRWIADYLQYTTERWFFLADLAGLDELVARDVTSWAKATLTRDRSHVVLVRPSDGAGAGGALTVAGAETTQDLAPWRAPVDPAEATRPLEPTQARLAAPVRDLALDNGMRVLLSPDPRSAVVEARLIYPVGTAADPENRPGLAYATALLVEPDFDIRDVVARATVLWALRLGTAIDWDVDEQTTTFTARGAALFADWHVWRLFYLLDHSTFPSDEVARMHRAAAAAGDPDRDARGAALRARLYGAHHPYAGDAVTGDDVARIGGSDCARFRRAYYHARGATLVIAGGFDADAMEREVRELFGTWSGAAPDAAPEVPAATPAAGPRWVAVPDDEAVQADVTIAFATRSDAERDRPARRILAELLDDRVRVVREGLGASYGLSVGYGGGAGGGAISIDGLIDPDRAGDAVASLVAELARLRDPTSDLAADFVRARRRALAAALADTAGTSAAAAELAFVGAHDLPPSYFDEVAGKIGATTLDEVRALIAADLAEDRMYVVVGARPEVLDAVFGALGVAPEAP